MPRPSRAPADGYTLLVATTAHAINMSLFKNSPAAPEVPTIAESGLPGYEVFAWNGLVAPAGTPKAVIAQLSEELRKAMQLPQVKEKFSVQGFAASWDTPEQFGSFLRAEVDKWTSGPRQ